MYDRYERDGGYSESRGRFWLGYLTGWGLATILQITVHSLDHGPDTTALQLNNEQLQTQLSRQFSPVDRLVLNHGDHTYTFATQIDGGQESCKGKYEDSKQDLATLVGPVACTHSITVTR